LLARFYLARPVNGGVVASFKPSYVMGGNATPAHQGKFALVAFDGAGAEVTRTTFEPQWTDNNEHEHHIIPVQIRIPYSATIARLDVVNGASTLASMTMSASAPSVRVDRATISGNTVHLKWSGRVEAGRTPVYTVFTSIGGTWFDERLFEVTGTSADLPILPKRRPTAVRVVVNDGSRNAQATVPLPPKPVSSP
jgi:hypothetical protein